MKLQLTDTNNWPDIFTEYAKRIEEERYNQAACERLFANIPDVEGYYTMLDFNPDACDWYLAVLQQYQPPKFRYYSYGEVVIRISADEPFRIRPIVDRMRHEYNSYHRNLPGHYVNMMIEDIDQDATEADYNEYIRRRDSRQ